MVGSELKRLTRDLLNDRGIDTWEYLDPSVWIASNLACQLAVSLVPCTRTTLAPITCSNGYVAIPVNVLTVEFAMTTRMLLRTTAASEDLANPLWRTLSDNPWSYMEEDGANIRLNRIPLAPMNVTLGVLTLPTVLTGDASTIDARFPTNVQNALKYATAAYLLTMDGEAKDQEMSNKFMAEFYRQIGIKMEQPTVARKAGA